MKVEIVAFPHKPASSTDNFPVITQEEIKSILYLGLKGNVQLTVGKKHTVDTYA
jgi:hypothetical protein